MTTPPAVDAPRLQPDRYGPRMARDVSIHDFTRAASPQIFSQYVFVPTRAAPNR